MILLLNILSEICYLNTLRLEGTSSPEEECPNKCILQNDLASTAILDKLSLGARTVCLKKDFYILSRNAKAIVKASRCLEKFTPVASTRNMRHRFSRFQMTNHDNKITR